MALMLRPVKDVLDVQGNISYNNGAGAWNIIRLPSRILRKFPQLKQKSETYGYRMIFFQTPDELIEIVENIKNKNEALPILLWMYRD